MSMLATLLLSVIVPASVAATILFAARLAGPSTVEARPDRWSVGPAIGLGYIVGHLILDWPLIPPGEANKRIPAIALAAILVGLVPSDPAWSRWLRRLAVTALTVCLILGPITFGEDFDTRAGLIRMGVLGLAMLASWAGSASMVKRSPIAGTWVSWFVMSAASSVTLIASGSIVLGELGLALTASIASTGLIAWRIPRFQVLRGSTPVVVAILAALLIDGYVYAGVTMTSLALLAASPIVAAIGGLGPLGRLSSGRRSMITIGLTVVMAGAAVGLAVAMSPSAGE